MRIVLFTIFTVFFIHTKGQGIDTAQINSESLPKDFTRRMDNRIEMANDDIVRQANKYLDKLSKQENKIRRRVAKIDSIAAAEMFQDIDLKYAELKQKISNPRQELNKLNSNHIPYLDSLQTSLNFLKSIGLTDKLKVSQSKEMQSVVDGINSIREKLSDAEDIRKFVLERRNLLLEKLTEFGAVKELKKFQHEFIYYQAAVNNIKENLNQPEKLVSIAISILNKLPTFQKFFQKNSQLASLFGLPANSSQVNSAMLVGMQTRASTQTILQERFGAAGLNINQSGSPTIQDGQNQLAQFQEKLNKIGGVGDLAMPNYTPNMERAKSLSKRIEIGGNMQTVKTNGFFPTTSDLAISIGYKATEKIIVGIGGAYKIGWGDSFTKIKITHQGIGLRSFLDFKIKGSLYLSGGAELNYRNQIREFRQLDEISAWQKSALIGITKKYSIAKKVAGNVQFLFDLLYAQQVPRTQLFLFRFGYNLR